MTAGKFSGSPMRKGLLRAALVGTAAVAALGLTGTEAMADTAAASFTYAQADWYAGASVSSSGTQLILQNDGNFVLYHDGTALWASGTNNVTDVDWSGSGYIRLKNSSGTTVCTIGALNPAPGGHANVQDDGNLVFYKTNGDVSWASGTSGFAQGNVNYCYT